MSTLTPPQLTDWIDDLRGRLERGELAGLGPMQLQPWSRLEDAESGVRELLVEVDHWRAASDGARAQAAAVTAQNLLAADLEALYERLVEGQEPAAVGAGSAGETFDRDDDGML